MVLFTIGEVLRGDDDDAGSRGRRLRRRGSGRTAPLDIKKIAPDCGHDRECPGAVQDRGGHAAGTDGRGEVQ